MEQTCPDEVGASGNFFLRMVTNATKLTHCCRTHLGEKGRRFGRQHPQLMPLIVVCPTDFTAPRRPVPDA